MGVAIVMDEILYGINKVVSDNNVEILLQYYVVSKVISDSTSKQSTIYGIKIKKFINDRLQEMDCIYGITYDVETIESMTDTILKCLVTPITLASVVDDMIA